MEVVTLEQSNFTKDSEVDFPVCSGSLASAIRLVIFLLSTPSGKDQDTDVKGALE